MKSYLSHSFDPQELPAVFDELPLWSAPFGLRLLDAINYTPGLCMIDIGCGNGFPLTELAMRLGPTSKVYGIDPWTEALAQVRRKLNYYDIHHVQLIEGVSEHIPLDLESIDLITSNNGLNNVSDVRLSIAECARVLRTGGRMVQTMNTAEFYRELEHYLIECGLEECVEAMHHHIRGKRPPVAEIVTKMQACGFRIEAIHPHEFHYHFANGTAMFNHYFIRLAFMDSWKKLIPEDRIEEAFDYLENTFNNKAAAAGSIRLTIPFVLIDAVKDKVI
ncbi:MAG TPA: class I SAM-dependent methyltransferase [Saprospiraceae bacterium]|nr:class I SAM-dependent methyltransferase [Saprospiraceae bacterium]